MWSPARVFNLALLIYKVFSIAEAFPAAACGAGVRELHTPSGRALWRGPSASAPGRPRHEEWGFPLPHWVNKSQEFISAGTCLIWRKDWRKMGSAGVIVNIIYGAIWIQEKAIWNLIKFSSFFFFLLCGHGWVISEGAGDEGNTWTRRSDLPSVLGSGRPRCLVALGRELPAGEDTRGQEPENLWNPPKIRAAHAWSFHFLFLVSAGVLITFWCKITVF